MEETIASPIDDSIGVIAAGKELVIHRSENANKTFTTWGDDATLENEDDEVDDATVITRIPITLFSVGDIAYQSTIYDREHRANNWCNRCEWGREQWTHFDPDPDTGVRTGPLWTLESMEAQREKIRQQCPRKKKDGTPAEWSSKEKKGMTTLAPLFTHIPVDNWLVCILHAIDLFVNTWVDLIFRYIDYRLEDRPIELLEARQSLFDASIMKDRRWNNLTDYKATPQVLQDELDDLEEEDGLPTCDDDAVYSTIEELIAAIKIQKDIIKAEQLLHAEAAASAREIAAAIVKLEKLKVHGALTQATRQVIKEMLQDIYHIFCSAYHGGDMEGNYCRKFMSIADEILDDIEDKLIEVNLAVEDDEIRKYFKGFKRMLQYMDLLSFYCYHPYYGTLTSSQVDDVKYLVPLMDNLWRKMTTSRPVKAHMWFHFIDDLERFRGMKHHHESKAETAHQDGRKLEMILRNVADIEEKIDVGLKYIATKEDPNLQGKQRQVHLERSRRFKDTSKRLKNKQLRKRQKTVDIESVLELPEITDHYPSLLELGKLDRMTEID